MSAGEVLVSADRHRREVATKSSRNLYRRAADTENFQHSLGASPETHQGIGGPPIHCTGKKFR